MDFSRTIARLNLGNFMTKFSVPAGEYRIFLKGILPW